MTPFGYLVVFSPYVLLMGTGIGLPLYLDWGIEWSIAGGIAGFILSLTLNLWLVVKLMSGR